MSKKKGGIESENAELSPGCDKVKATFTSTALHVFSKMFTLYLFIYAAQKIYERAHKKYAQHPALSEHAYIKHLLSHCLHRNYSVLTKSMVTSHTKKVFKL